MTTAEAFPPIESLLAHRGRSLLIERVLGFDGASARCRALASPDHPYFLEGKIQSIVAVELIAQCVGAHVGLLRREQGLGPLVGYLIGVPQMKFAQPQFPASAALDVSTEVLWNDALSGSFGGRVSTVDGALIAGGRVTVFQPPGGAGLP